LDRFSQRKKSRSFVPVGGQSRHSSKSRRTREIFEYRAGHARQFARDFGFCKKKKFATVRVQDPYSLASDFNAERLKQFLSTLLSLMEAWPDRLELQVRDDANSNFQPRRKAFEGWLAKQGATSKITSIPTHGPHRRDFHDRCVAFVPNAKTPQNRYVVLLTGGVDRYMEPQCECTVVVHRTL
jgi:hypothetical protein